MTPESQLCLKRLLSGDHMPYFVKIANQQEPEILYVYVNSIRDIKRFVDQQLIIKPGSINDNSYQEKKNYQRWKAIAHCLY